MIRRWLVVLVILLAAATAAGQDKPHVVIFTSAGCQPCMRLKSDLATSPALAPVSQAAWVNVYDASSPRAAEYRAGRSVPVIIVVEPMVGGRWRECFRQVGYNGDPAALAETLQVRCQLLRRLICRPRPQPNPGVPPQPDDGTVVPIPDGGGQIPIPDDGPPPNPADDPVVPDPVQPGCTPPECIDEDCRAKIAELEAELAEWQQKRVILQTVDTSGKVIQQASAPLGTPIKLRLVPVQPKGDQ